MNTFMQLVEAQGNTLAAESGLSESERGAYMLAFMHGLSAGANHVVQIMQPENAAFKNNDLETLKRDVIAISELIHDCAMEQTHA